MSSSELRNQANRRFDEALERTGARDPREFYRQRLRELRERNPDAYQKALAYFETRLVPAVATVDSDPLQEWLEYGRMLARLVADGRTVQIDESGRASDFARPVPLHHLVLHLPLSTREPVLVVGLPGRLSPAQRATYELLVTGKRG